MMKTYIHHIIAVATLVLAATVTSTAQKADNTFTVMTLNVDGLPAKVLYFDVNDDGPMSAGSELISAYLADRQCDIIAMQENFNYRWEIWSYLYADYVHDEWSGGIMTDENPPIDYYHLQNYRFPTDGLNMSWKKDITPTGFERVRWEQNFGKFSHSCDDIATKGFRRHEFTLANGTDIVVYNMHMDASTLRDEYFGNDLPDRQARKAQWEQLRQHILDHLDQRPVIVTGDMNSLYHRDPVKEVFIDAINQTGRATAGDARVELQLAGQYPMAGGEADASEVLDKILYINPTDADKKIVPQYVVLDTDNYLLDYGKPLGDHYPLIVTFAVTNSSSGITATRLADGRTKEPAYTLQGTPVTDNTRGLHVRKGQKTIVK